MTNIKSVFIKDDNDHEKYFEINFVNGDSLQIGDDKLLKLRFKCRLCSDFLYFYSFNSIFPKQV